MTGLARLSCCALLALTLAACGSGPTRVELGHSYSLVDSDGRIAGRVSFSPVGGGGVYDNDNNLIGRIVPPGQ